MQAYWGTLPIAFVVMGCFGLPAQSAPITKLEQQQAENPSTTGLARRAA
jgi:hypothetical protein